MNPCMERGSLSDVEVVKEDAMIPLEVLTLGDV